MTETVTITTKQDFINFLTSCISVDKRNPSAGENVTITIQSDKTLVAGDGVSDLDSIVIYFWLYGTGWSDQRGTVRRNTTAIDNWTSNDNTSIDVGGLTAGSLNELLNHGFSFTSSFTGTGTIDPWIQIETTWINVSEGASRNSAFYIQQSFPVTLVLRDVIATATTTVYHGRSSTDIMTLLPYGVYLASSNLEENTLTMDTNYVFELDPTDCDLNNWDGGWDYFPLLSVPNEDVSQFEQDYFTNGEVIDPINFWLQNIVHHDTEEEYIKFQFKDYTLYLCTGDEYYCPYDNTTITMGSHQYTLTRYDMVPLNQPVTYINNHSRQDLIPGNTYQINGVYSETGHYERCEGIGQLQMLKCPTTTTISTTDTSITLGDVVTLTVTVTDALYNSTLTSD